MSGELNMQDGSHSPFERLVLGIAGIGGVWKDVNEKESVDTILHALYEGVGSVDVAPSYNNGEEILGKALRQWQGLRPKISTKVGRLKAKRSDIDLFDFSPSSMQRSFYNSLEVLGVEKVDLLFLHDPKGLNPKEAGKAIEQLERFKQDGLTGSLGIGGNYPSWFEIYADSHVFEVFMGYNRLNAANLDALHAEVKTIREKGLIFYAASPLHMGLLGSRFSEFSMTKPSWINEQDLMKAKELAVLARQEELSLADLALQFLKELNVVDKVVIGPCNRFELTDSLSAWKKSPLPSATIDKILSLHTNPAFNDN